MHSLLSRLAILSLLLPLISALFLRPRESLFTSSSGDTCSDSLCSTRFNTSDGGLAVCQKAYKQFQADQTYNSQSTYTNGHCAATFACNAVQSWKGSDIQTQFAKLYASASGAGVLDGPGCQACGAHYFTGNSSTIQCVVTTAYCTTCQNSGGPIDITPSLSEQ